MANIYKKAAERQRVQPGGVDVQKEELVVQGTPEPVKTEPEKAETGPAEVADLLDGIGDVTKDLKATYSLYLSKSVMDEVKKRSKAAKMSNAAYLDELLKRVFGL